VARAVWSGTISFGLVNIPVRLYNATSPRDVRFHLFDRESGRRIHYQRVAGPAIEEETAESVAPWTREPEPAAPDEPAFERSMQETATESAPDREVAFEDVVKGYEIEPGRFVMVSPEDLRSLEPERTHTIDIEHFVQLEDIDPIFFEKSYYVAPQRGAEKPYALLLEAMRRAGKVGIARFVLRTKPYLAAVRPMDEVLVLETLFFADEVRELKEVPNVPTGVLPGDRELDLAEKLIDMLGTTWDPSAYADEYRQRMLELIEARAETEGAVQVLSETTPEAESKLPELLAALKASVEQAKKESSKDKPTGRRRGAG
jgi:DNA end-binding protein Ku